MAMAIGELILEVMGPDQKNMVEALQELQDEWNWVRPPEYFSILLRDVKGHIKKGQLLEAGEFEFIQSRTLAVSDRIFSEIMHHRPVAKIEIHCWADRTMATVPMIINREQAKSVIVARSVTLAGCVSPTGI